MASTHGTVTRPGFFPQLAHRLGARSFDFDTPDLRMSTLLASDSDLGHAFSDAWALLREEVDGVVAFPDLPEVRGTSGGWE